MEKYVPQLQVSITYAASIAPGKAAKVQRNLQDAVVTSAALVRGCRDSDIEMGIRHGN